MRLTGVSQGAARRWLLVFSVAALPGCGAAAGPAAQAPAASAAPDEGRVAPPNRIRHRGQDLYLSGFNIAWFDFARDVGRGLDEVRLRQAVADLVAAGGNTLRWW